MFAGGAGCSTESTVSELNGVEIEGPYPTTIEKVHMNVRGDGELF